MKTVREIVTLEDYADFNETFPDFRVRFQDKVNVFKITDSFEFEINLKEEFADDIRLQKEILNFIKKLYSDFKVSFVPDELPF